MNITKTQLLEFCSDVILQAQKTSNLVYKDKTYEETDPRHRRMFIAKDALETVLEDKLSDLFEN